MPKVIRTLPPAGYLRQCFDYDPHTGILHWRERPPEHFVSLRGYKTWNATIAGRPVGSVSKQGGGLQTSLEDQKFYVARIIWKMRYGTEPDLIDHIDRNPLNNRLDNLRSADDRQNAQNKLRRTGASGLTGVTIIKKVKPGGKRFMATIKGPDKPHYLGTYVTAEEAHAAYRKAAAELFGGFDPFKLQHYS